MARKKKPSHQKKKPAHQKKKHAMKKHALKKKKPAHLKKKPAHQKKKPKKAKKLKPAPSPRARTTALTKASLLEGALEPSPDPGTPDSPSP
jgi:hypothetical protein